MKVPTLTPTQVENEYLDVEVPDASIAPVKVLSSRKLKMTFEVLDNRFSPVSVQFKIFKRAGTLLKSLAKTVDLSDVTTGEPKETIFTLSVKLGKGIYRLCGVPTDAADNVGGDNCIQFKVKN